MYIYFARVTGGLPLRHCCGVSLQMCVPGVGLIRGARACGKQYDRTDVISALNVQEKDGRNAKRKIREKCLPSTIVDIGCIKNMCARKIV